MPVAQVYRPRVQLITPDKLLQPPLPLTFLDQPAPERQPSCLQEDLLQKTHNWAFYQLRLFVNYKAAIAGVPVVFVPPAYTSQTCSRCHRLHPEKGKSYRNGKKFKCGHCGFEHDADINAACNIADLGKTVSLPESPGIACLLEGQLPLFRFA